MSNQKTLYVTDAGSVSIGGSLFMPGCEIPIEMYQGRESALREHVRENKVSTRRRRMRTDDTGRVIKIDRSSNAPVLPTELDEYDPKKRRELRPLTSKIEGGHEVAAALAKLKRFQQDQEAGKARETKEVAEAAITQAKKEAREASVDADALAEIARESAPPDGDYDESDSDELFAEDAELLEELQD